MRIYLFSERFGALIKEPRAQCVLCGLVQTIVFFLNGVLRLQPSVPHGIIQVV